MPTMFGTPGMLPIEDMTAPGTQGPRAFMDFNFDSPEFNDQVLAMLNQAFAKQGINLQDAIKQNPELVKYMLAARDASKVIASNPQAQNPSDMQSIIIKMLQGYLSGNQGQGAMGQQQAGWKGMLGPALLNASKGMLAYSLQNQPTPPTYQMLGPNHYIEIPGKKAPGIGQTLAAGLLGGIQSWQNQAAQQRASREKKLETVLPLLQQSIKQQNVEKWKEKNFGATQTHRKTMEDFEQKNLDLSKKKYKELPQRQKDLAKFKAGLNKDYPEDYQKSLANALESIAAGKNPNDVFKIMAVAFPKIASQLKTILVDASFVPYDVKNAIAAASLDIKQGADPKGVYRTIASQYPRYAKIIKRILLPNAQIKIDIMGEMFK